METKQCMKCKDTKPELGRLWDGGGVMYQDLCRTCFRGIMDVRARDLANGHDWAAPLINFETVQVFGQPI